MKTAGHVAYDAFRKEIPWLLEWNSITDEMRQAWEATAQAVMTLSSGAEANPPE